MDLKEGANHDRSPVWLVVIIDIDTKFESM